MLIMAILPSTLIIFCNPCSFVSRRTGFDRARRVWNGSVDPSPAKCEVPSVIWFLNAKVNIHRNFTDKLLLFMVTLWIGKMWRIGAVNSPKEGLIFTTNKEAVGHLFSLTTFSRKVKRRNARKSTRDSMRVASHPSRSV